MQQNVKNTRAAVFGGVLIAVVSVGAELPSALAGPCYSLDSQIYCTQCPGASCDAECEGLATYDACNCPPFSCDPPPCNCVALSDSSLIVCGDPPETWIGLHAKYIIGFGSDWANWSDPHGVFARFIGNDQAETCFDQGCNDETWVPPDDCWGLHLKRTMESADPVGGGQVEFTVWALEPGDYGVTAVVGLVSSCGGGELGGGYGTSFYDAPVLSRLGGYPPKANDPPQYIPIGSTIPLELALYCDEAYLDSESGLELYKKCNGAMEEIQSGQPLAAYIDSGCEIGAIATEPGAAKITLTGKDTWNRPQECRVPLRFKVVEMDVDLPGVDDAVENLPPGKYMRLNDDDDNKNGIADFNESNVAGDDDLIPMNITQRGVDCPFKHQLSCTSGVRVWQDQSKSGLPLASGDYLTTSTLWIEGIGSDTQSVGANLWILPTGATTWSPIHSDTVAVDVICFSLDEPDGLPLTSFVLSNPDPQPKVFRSAPPYCFEWQFVHSSGVVVPYSQPISGIICGAQDPGSPYHQKWEVNKGSLTSTTDPETEFHPFYPCVPAGMDTVTLKLSMNPPHDKFKDERTLEVYRDHLERDHRNFGTGGSCEDDWSFLRYGLTINMDHTWNCHGSVIHAYNGTGSGYSEETVAWSQAVYWTPIDWDALASSLQRGDVVSFWGPPDDPTAPLLLHHSHTCMGSPSQMYGANNEPTIDPYSEPMASWKWFTCSSKEYFENVNAAWRQRFPDGPDLLDTVTVHKRP